MRVFWWVLFGCLFFGGASICILYELALMIVRRQETFNLLLSIGTIFGASTGIAIAVKGIVSVLAPNEDEEPKNE